MDDGFFNTVSVQKYVMGCDELQLKTGKWHEKKLSKYNICHNIKWQKKDNVSLKSEL